MKFLITILFIALQAINTPAIAQNGLQIANSQPAKAVVTTERVRAELMAHAPQGVTASNDDKIGPNTVWVGLQLAHQPQWHTYWKNSGDSGAPTLLEWTLPVGVLAGDIAWPAPHKIRIGSLANYGYEGTVLLAVPLTVTPAFKPSLLNSNLDIKLKAQWLVCKKECVPEDGEFALSIPTKGSTAIHTAVFEAALKAQPKPVIGNVAGVIPNSRALIEGNDLSFELQGLPVEWRGKTLALFPETPEVIDNNAVGKQAWQGAVWRMTLPQSAQRSASPTAMPVVLTVVDASDAAKASALRAELPVVGTWAKVAEAATVSPGLAAALNANVASQATQNANLSAAPVNLSLFAALLGALLGGLILNLMPCVFPVLALKVVGFAQHATHSDRALHRQSGIAYLVGVVLSFVALGGLFLGLRAGGEKLGWGFQLQNPAVVAGLAVLFTVIGLNLAGLFEFGSVLPSSVAMARAKHPMIDSFLSGVLAVAVASPCTAPFMGASLGFALGLPAGEALLIFAAIGVGMALPFVAASFIPAVARALPRPGAWMDTFKKFMAFPMFATVVWLVWVLGQQSGIDGAGALLMLLVALTMVLWAFSLQGKSKLWFAIISVAILAYLTPAIGINVIKNADLEVSAAQTAQTSRATPTGERWQAWEPGRVDQLLAEGKPVFVDFTAAWCVTCQYNKKTTLSKADVLADFDAKKVQLLRADWTRRDPAISAALAQLGRSGVPVYVVYAPGKPPVVLSEVISADDVHAVLAKL